MLLFQMAVSLTMTALKRFQAFILKNLEKIFRYEVLKMLKKVKKINDAVIENIDHPIFLQLIW